MSESLFIPVEPAPEVPVVETPETPSAEPVASETTPPAEEKAEQVDNLPKPDKSQSKFDKRIAALNRKIGEEKARAEFLSRQLEELKPKPQNQEGLKLEDFDFDVEKYAEAKAKKAEEAALKRYGEEQQAQTMKQMQESLLQGWESKVGKADSKYDDFEEIVGELKPTNPLNIAIMQAENGEDIAYYLGNNLKEAQRIANLDPIAAIREIGRIEAKLLNEPLKAKEPSKAPEPISPVKGTGKVSKDPVDMSQSEFEEYRKKVIKNTRR